MVTYGGEASRYEYGRTAIRCSMKLSIVTVCFNSVRTLGDTIASVAAQEYPYVEHIVVDGASTDGTLDVIERYRGKLAKVVSEPDRGIYDAMNKGISLASGDVIGFLNSDDSYQHTHVLEKVADVMMNEEVDACYADLVYVDPIEPARVVRYWKSSSFEAGLFSTGWVPPHPTFYVRRSVFQRFGQFDTRYRLAADFDLMVRLLERHRVAAVHIPEVMVRMRLGGATSQSLRNIMRQNIEIYRSFRGNGLQPPSLPVFIMRKLVARGTQFWGRPIS